MAMGKVIIFASVVAVIIGAVAVGILVIGGSAKLTSLLFRKKPVKPKEERSASQIEDANWLNARYDAIDRDERLRDDRRP
jgi:outer membrane murein-binding lipoprotein Lpp